MYSSNHRKTRKCRRTIALILTIIITIILAIPSFAENEAAEADDPIDGPAAQMEDTTEEAPGDAEEQLPEDGGDPDAEKSQPDEETSAENTLEKSENQSGASDEADIEEDKKEPKDGKAKAEEPEVIKAPAPKAGLMKASSEKGKEVSYSGEKKGSAAGETTIFKVVSDGKTYTGTCAEQGVTMKSSGTATITEIPNSKKIAKIVYHYAIELGDDNWWSGDHKTDKVGKLLGMNNDSDTNVTKRRMIEAFCQIYNMGTTDWYKTITNASTGDWNADTADRVRDFYTDISDKNWYKDLTVPKGFEIWFADAGNNQPFMIWSYNPTGFVTMKKISGDTSITG